MTKRLPDHAWGRLARAARDAERPDADHAAAIFAVASGLITAAQLDEARAEQDRQAAAGTAPESLGQILVRKGYLRRQHYQELLRARVAPAPVPDIEPGASFGRYEIRAILGRGGMSVVYRALDRQLRRDVALKVLRFSGDAALLERLHREARATARLSHPNIVALHESGSVGEIHYLTMDLVPGESLSRRLPTLNLETKIAVLEKVARAVDYAHAQGIVHRDLKPGNILIKPDGEPVVMDFGLARSLEGEESLTVTGGIVGTPLYMAPEQIAGRGILPGPASDVYALGVILYQMLAGRTPHQAESVAQLAHQIATQDPIPPHRLASGVPPALSTICLQALEKDPRRRYPSAAALADDLLRWRSGEPIAARPPGPMERAMRRILRRREAAVAAVAAALVIAGTLGFVVPQWIEVRRDARRQAEAAQQREEALKTLGTLWMKIVVARKDFYQPQTDPARARGKVEEALRELDAYVAAHPGQAQGRFIRARARLALGNLRGAHEDLAHAVAADPAFGPAWALLARTMIEQSTARLYQGDVRAAAIEIEEAAACLQKARQTPPERWAPQSWGLLAAEEDETAHAVAQALARRYVDGDPDGARRQLEAAAQERPSEDFYLWLAAWEPDLRRRLDWLDRALHVMPHCARALLDRGTARALLGDAAGALADYAQALRIEPDSPLVYYNRAVARRAAGATTDALSDAQRCAALDPLDPSGWALLGLLQYETGAYAQAITTLSRALELAPDDAALRNRRGTAFHKRGDLERARQDYDAAIRIDPAYAEAYYNRGILRTTLGHAAEAQQDLERAAQLGYTPR